jgi:hypothetical protein
MDMTFRDDECRIRQGDAPAIFATVKRTAHNLTPRAPGQGVHPRKAQGRRPRDDEHIVSLVAA